jgi:hypothetical protein
VIPPAEPAGSQDGGPARRTRASTKSPAKHARPPAQPPLRIPRKASQQQKRPKPIVEGVEGHNSSPLRPRFPPKKKIFIPRDLVGYSQARSDEEFVEEEEEPGLIIHGAFGHPAQESSDKEDVSTEHDMEPATPHHNRHNLQTNDGLPDLELPSDCDSDDDEGMYFYHH